MAPALHAKPLLLLQVLASHPLILGLILTLGSLTEKPAFANKVSINAPLLGTSFGLKELTFTNWDSTVSAVSPTEDVTDTIKVMLFSKKECP